MRPIWWKTSWQRLLATPSQLYGFSGLSPCKADPDTWIKKSKRADNSDYWEYVLLFIDDCICISTDPEDFVGKKSVNIF